MPCADIATDDNEHYVGHDEPEVQFFSSTPGSGYDLEWKLKLSVERYIATQPSMYAFA